MDIQTLRSAAANLGLSDECERLIASGKSRDVIGRRLLKRLSEGKARAAEIDDEDLVRGITNPSFI
jgi:hypothetical protein